MPDLQPPQMVVESRMLYFTWVPEHTDVVRALVPAELELSDKAQCFINQHVVDSEDHTSGFGTCSRDDGVRHQATAAQGLPAWWRLRRRLRGARACPGARAHAQSPLMTGDPAARARKTPRGPSPTPSNPAYFLHFSLLQNCLRKRSDGPGRHCPGVRKRFQMGFSERSR